MNWIPLTNLSQLDEAINHSFVKDVVLFKHSTRCSISRMAMSRIERSWHETAYSNYEFYYLDLLTYRIISNEIAIRFNIVHESPQLLLLRKGEVQKIQNHNSVNIERLK